MKKNLLYYPNKLGSTIKNEGIVSLYKLIYSFILSRYKRKFTRKEDFFKSWIFLKNKYKNKRVFLIGNGPSLNKTPLHFLKDEYSIVFNRFNLMFERLNWMPTFYTTVDERVAEDNANEINNINKDITHSFFPDIHPRGTDFRKFITKRHNVHWLKLYGRGYSSDLPNCGLNGTVANVGIQILIYLGFKEIYLIGVDMNYLNQESVFKEDKRDWVAKKDDDPNHFDPRYFGKGKKYHRPRIDDLVLPGYVNAKKFSKEKGVRIYNSTYGGQLEVFERVNFDRLFNFSEKKQFNLLFGSKYEFKGRDLIDSFPSAINIEKEIEITTEVIKKPNNILILNHNLGIKYINKLIFNYLPKGPIFNKYIFFPR